MHSYSLSWLKSVLFLMEVGVLSLIISLTYLDTLFILVFVAFSFLPYSVKRDTVIRVYIEHDHTRHIGRCESPGCPKVSLDTVTASRVVHKHRLYEPNLYGDL